MEEHVEHKYRVHVREDGIGSVIVGVTAIVIIVDGGRERARSRDMDWEGWKHRRLG